MCKEIQKATVLGKRSSATGVRRRVGAGEGSGERALPPL